MSSTVETAKTLVEKNCRALYYYHPYRFLKELKNNDIIEHWINRIEKISNNKKNLKKKLFKIKIKENIGEMFSKNESFRWHLILKVKIFF